MSNQQNPAAAKTADTSKAIPAADESLTKKVPLEDIKKAPSLDEKTKEEPALEEHESCSNFA